MRCMSQSCSTWRVGGFVLTHDSVCWVYDACRAVFWRLYMGLEASLCCLHPSATPLRLTSEHVCYLLLCFMLCAAVRAPTDRA
jgi:hypothetical protein